MWLSCLLSWVVGSVLLVDLTTAHCERVREHLWYLAVILRQRAKFSFLIRPWINFSCFWDVKQPRVWNGEGGGSGSSERSWWVNHFCQLHVHIDNEQKQVHIFPDSVFHAGKCMLWKHTYTSSQSIWRILSPCKRTPFHCPPCLEALRQSSFSYTTTEP